MPSKDAHCWTPSDVGLCRGLIATDLDAAWRLWHRCAGGARRPSTVVEASLWAAGWAVGDADQAVARLWRRHRQAAALCTLEGDQQALRYLAKVSALIDEHTAARLQTWRDSVHTRAGAASWVKHRCQQTCDHRLQLDWTSGAALRPGEAPSHPAAWEALPLSPEASQTNTAEELATRWNAGLYRYPRKQPVPPQLSAIAPDEVLEELAPLWYHRTRCAGPVRALLCALTSLGIIWPDPDHLQCGPFSLWPDPGGRSLCCPGASI